ncbi:lipoprotein LpqH [Nocardia sp. NPDC088792]|uniref:lipoprotein LpqH n=1 Tax=Nocardia sp. NPDC088792 TaxID=3364332 RepID=UPI0038038A7B
MNTKSIRLATTAAVAGTAAVALLVTGCSSNSSSSPAGTTSAAPVSATLTSAPASSAAKDAPAAGGSSATVGGKAITANFTTTCAKQGGNLALALTDNSNSTYGTLSVSATLTGGSTVQAVGIAGTKGGSNGAAYAVGYGNGVPGGSATVTKTGNTYEVKGTGVGAVDMSNPMAGPQNESFDITFACTTIVGA